MLMFLYFFLLSLVSQRGCALECLACHGITHPRYCNVVETCGVGEVCFAKSVKALDDAEVFILGCTAKHTSPECTGIGNTTKCSECCETELCNAGLCGQQGYPVSRGPICYRCDSRLLSEKCSIIDFCAADEVCSVEEKQIFSDVIYTSGCTSRHLCTEHHHGDLIVGKRRTDESLEDDQNNKNCKSCCTADLCNDRCYTHKAHDCLDLLGLGVRASGVHIVTMPKSYDKVQVYCDMNTDGGGWTVFQNRYDGHVNFDRNMSTYENGFGNITGEFWLGLSYIYELSTFCPGVDLRLDLEKADGTKGYEIFQNFSLSSAPTYTLHIERGTGTLGDAGDGLSNSNNHTFTTSEMGRCAGRYVSGWWFNNCFYVNLNGVYLHPPGSTNSSRGMIYYEFNGQVSLKSSKMMVRRNLSGKC